MVGLLTFAVTYADALIVRSSLGQRDTGLYGAAYRLVLVLQFLPSIYLDSAYRTMAHLAAEAREAFGTFVDRSTAGLFLLSLPFAVGGLLIGDRVLVLAFGSAFAPAAPAFRALLWSLPFAFPSWMLISAVVVGDRPQTAGWILGGAFVGNVAVNLAVVPTFGIEAAGWTTVATEACITVAASLVLHKRGVPVRWPVLAAPGAVAAAAMGLALIPIRDLPLFVPLVVGPAVYFGLLGALRTPARLGLRLPGRRAV
jgi:O-antigen/teichoic acid export membrane protein